MAAGSSTLRFKLLTDSKQYLKTWDKYDAACEWWEQHDLKAHTANMCIEFVYINNSPADDGFKLIVSNNRDEFYSRPTKPAAFWDEHSDCMSGLDIFPGREGGTWFAASKTGKIGCLLNILSPEGPLSDKLGRGHLVTDYVSQNVAASDYLQVLSNKASSFNLFNLTLLEKSDIGRWELFYFTNSLEAKQKVLRFPNDGIYAVGNSVINKPFQKVLRGKELFSSIVEEFGRTGTRVEMEEALLKLMSDKTCTMPDAQLTKQAGDALDDRLKAQRSGIYVHSPQIDYGTRTTTLVTVSADDCCTYTEHTMKEPINTDNPEWQKVSYTFNI